MALSKVGKNQVDQSASLTVDGDLTVDTDTLYVNSANNKVAVGTASPSTKFHVQSAGDNYITSRDSTSGGIAGVILQNGSDTRGIRINGSSLQLHDHSANLTRLNIDASGHVTMPYQPAFSAYNGPGPGITSAAYALAFTSGVTNVGGHYSTSTYRFTAPVAGTYFFMHNAMSNGGYNRTRYKKNGAYVGNEFFSGNVGYTNLVGSIVLTLAVNDYVQVWNDVGGNGQGDVHADYRAFSGFLIG